MSVRINVLMGGKNWSSYWLLHKHLVTRLLPSYLLSHIGLHKRRLLFYMPRILLSSLQMELLQIKLIPGRRSSPHYRNELRSLQWSPVEGKECLAKHLCIRGRGHAWAAEKIVPYLRRAAGGGSWKRHLVLGCSPLGSLLCLGYRAGWGFSPKWGSATNWGAPALVLPGLPSSLSSCCTHCFTTALPLYFLPRKATSSRTAFIPNLRTLGCSNCLLSLLFNLVLPHKGNRIKWNASLPVCISLLFFFFNHWNSALLSH